MFAALTMTLPSDAVAQGYTNPVLKGVADAGVIRYGGKYYLGGVATYGDFFVSENLIDWNRRVHVFDLDNDWTHGTGAKNNQVHADDISYNEGLFHLLFSVNYWGDDQHIVHITHATSPSVEGPYKEVREDQWYENRIDPQVFCDEDGQHYLYMVKFTDGNTIWARPLNGDYSFAGDAVCQFSSQPGTWETADNRVAEGPFVVKYRGRYYMMYNANHTSPQYGNYRLGVCEADTPMGFNAGGKYPYPVVSPQTEALCDNYTDLITFGGAAYNPVRLVSDTIAFKCNHRVSGQLMMKIVQRGGCEISLNGHAVNAAKASEYCLVAVDKKWLHEDDNVITVKRNDKKARLVDLALYDTSGIRTGELQLTPGQPNIVRGPNGWEWWLVYMANSGWSRSQYVDRIQFTRNRLRVDGITGANTDGASYAPAMPIFSGTSLDSVPSASDSFLAELTFSVRGGSCGVSIGGKSVQLPAGMQSGMEHQWRIEKNFDHMTVWIDSRLVADNIVVCPHDNKLKWTGDSSLYDVKYISYTPGFDEYGSRFSGWDGLEADNAGLQLVDDTDVLKGEASSNYEFSAMFHNNEPAQGEYGLYASYTDQRNFVRATIDAPSQTFVVDKCTKGRFKTEKMPLTRTGVHYPDIKYTDSYEKQYRFDCDTYVSSVELPRLKADADTYARVLNLDEDRNKTFIPNMASTQQMAWLDGDTWRPLSATAMVDAARPDWQKLSFSPIKTRALRFINASPTDNSRNIYRIKKTADFAADYQLRVEKRCGEIRIYVDDHLMTTLSDHADKPSRVGLYSRGTDKSVSVKNTLYYVVKQ